MRPPIAVVLAVAVSVGCTAVSPETTQPRTSPPVLTPATDSRTQAPSGAPAGDSALGELYELPADRDVAESGEPLASLTGQPLAGADGADQTVLPGGGLALSREGWRVDLMGLYRLGEDRVLAEFRLNAADAVRADMMVWGDPERGARGDNPDDQNYEGMFYEFSDVRLTVGGDDTTYLPVRTESSFCLCAMSLASLRSESDTNDFGDYLAYVVMSSPKNVSDVTLTIRDVGEFTGVVAEQIPTRSVTSLGFGYQLRVLAVTRPSPGIVRVRFSIEIPAGGISGVNFGVKPMYQLGAAPWKAVLSEVYKYETLLVTDALAEFGGWPKERKADDCESCTKLVTLHTSGTGVDGEIDFPDPGSDEVLVFPASGWPLSVPVSDGSSGSVSDKRVRYQLRSQTEGASISDEGIDIDASVLFDVDKAVLTSKANGVLDKVAAKLTARAPGKLSIIGHTDSTGSESHNLDLSKRRAEAVRKALEGRLGSDWSFVTKGVGESEPKVSESGLSGAELDQARSLNRRVEVRFE